MLKRVLLALWISGCGPAAPPPAAAEPDFDGPRAFRDLVELVRIGPRPAGSEGAARARALIGERLRQAGWRVELQPLRAGPGGGVEMVNVIGRRRGKCPHERILLITHYDTKRMASERFVGANDGASGVALLLELARQLGALPPRPFTIELAFVDGEEAFGENITREDGLYGSRALAERMQAEGRIESIRALVLVDMVADRDLNLTLDRNSTPALVSLLREEAARMGLSHLIDPRVRLRLIDDHTPFVRRGVREVLALIDFQYGARETPGPFWHTERDDLAAVSAESLNSVGGLVVQTLGRIEQRLLARADAR